MNRAIAGWMLATFALMTSTAIAADVAGVKLDDTIRLDGQELRLNGAGLRTRLMFKVYVASLYLPQRANDVQSVLAKAPRRIQMNMLRSLSADQLADALNDGLADNNPPQTLAAIKPQIEQLSAIMKAFKDVKENDVVTLDFIGGATRVGLNGESRGAIPGEAFNQALSRIWLGDKPVQPELRKALLGL